ncbi:MAG: DUF2948 family protein [Paracoccaceae bacterium]
MVEDAKFEDGGDQPLHLKALDAEDLAVISALAQDAILPAPEMRFDMDRRRFALLLNRFRWEDVPAAQTRGRPPERVQTLLWFEDVLSVASTGIDRNDPDLILSLLAISFTPGVDGTGRIELTLAGDGAIALNVEALDATIKDVTRPYIAPSKHIPTHD